MRLDQAKRLKGIVKLTKSSSSDPQDTGLQSVANPPYWAPKAAVSLNLTIPAGVLEAAKGFRRVQGCQDMPALVAALRARDARLGLGESSEMVA